MAVGYRRFGTTYRSHSRQSLNPEITRRGTETLQTKTTLVLPEEYMIMHNCSVEIPTDVLSFRLLSVGLQMVWRTILTVSEILHSKNEQSKKHDLYKSNMQTSLYCIALLTKIMKKQI
jgi:hypothetical protein